MTVTPGNRYRGKERTPRVMQHEQTVRRIRDGLVEMARLEKSTGNRTLAVKYADRAAVLTWVLDELPELPTTTTNTKEET